MKQRLLILLLVLTITPILCASGQSEVEHLKMATTTSTENSGLLDELLPLFEEDYGIKVDIIAVGTGKAIKLGENGDVDLILVHAREKEDQFVQDNFGINRKDVMFNDFIILGPENDPAEIMGMTDSSAALVKIKNSSSSFLSRGDDSGTHTKELFLWIKSGIAPSGEWYKETGQGMGAVITMTNEIEGYTLTDRGTYLAMKDKLSLEIMVQGDNDLFNPYGIIAVNPEIHKSTNYQGAVKFIDFITSEKGQMIINNYKKNNEQLFFGNSSS